MKLRLAVALSGALLLLAGCGAGAEKAGSDRPSADELSASLRKGADVAGQKVAFSEKEADCIAKVLVDSKMSDASLEAIAAEKDDYEASEADKKVAAGLSTESCVERPTVAEVSAAFQKGVASASNAQSVLKIPKKQADCVADVLVNKSKLSNGALYQVVTGNVLDTGSANAKLVQAVQKDLTACGT